MDQTFEDANACRDYLNAHLALTAAGDAQKAAMLDGIAAACEEQEADAPTTPAFALRLRRWVVRDQDLKLFEALSSVVLALAAATFAPLSLPAAGIGGLVVAVAALLNNARAHGTTITHRQVYVLTALRAAARPLTPNELLQALQAIGGFTWALADVERELTALSEAVTPNGKKAFVEALSSGAYCLTDV